MIRLFITGGSGTLGTDFQQVAGREGFGGPFEWVAPTSHEFDIGDPLAVARLAQGEWGKFDWILNFAAYTQVDRAEAERPLCFGLNAVAPGWLAQAALDLGARFLHLSTDCVFNGEKGSPYTEEDQPDPIQVYGESKWQGEIAVREDSADAVIFRTSWLYGSTGKSFPQTIRKKLLEGESIRVVDDQLGTPTDAADLSSWILQAIVKGIPGGTYHAAGPEVLSRYGWADQIQKALEAEIGKSTLPLVPISASDFPTPARRPMNSALDSTQLGLILKDAR